jgi:hypothetical protein
MEEYTLQVLIKHSGVEDLLGAAISKLELRHPWAKAVLTYVLKRVRWESNEKAA